MKKFGTIRVLLLVLLVCVLSAAPTIAMFAKKQDNITKSKLFGNTSQLQGVIVVWNIDTFEGGTISKSAFLEAQTKLFENENKGIYVLVKNLTPEEFEQKKDGEMPDVISFSSAIWEQVAPCVEDVAVSNKSVLSNIEEAVESDGQSKTYPWCLGGYFFLSTQDAVERCGGQCESLCVNRFDLGYSKTVGKTTRIIKSLTLGSSQYHSAYEALLTCGNVVAEALDENYASQTGYEAYVRFCGNNATILLGSQRDVARLENKLSQGAISDLLCEFVPWTDMMQCVSVVNQKDATRRKYAQKFCQFLQSEKVQNALTSIGMIPVCKPQNATSEHFASVAVQSVDKIVVKKMIK